MNSYFSFHFRTTRLQLDTNFAVDALAYIIERGRIVRLYGKAMRMDQGQLRVRVRREQHFPPVVQAFEVMEELESGSRQVHDIVGNGRRHGDANWLGPLPWWYAARHFDGFEGGAVSALRGFQHEVCGSFDEVVAVFVEGFHKLGHL